MRVMNKCRLLGIFIFFVQTMILHQQVYGIDPIKRLRKSEAQWRLSQETSKQFTGNKEQEENQQFRNIVAEGAETSQELQNQAESLTVTANKDSDAPAKSENQGDEEDNGGERKITRIRNLKLSDIKYDQGEMRQVLGAGGGMTAMAGLQMGLGELIGTAPSGKKDPKADSWKKEELNITSKDLMIREPKGKVTKSPESSTSQAAEAAAENAASTKQWFSGEKNPEEIKARARAEGVYQSMPFEAFEGE